MSAIDAIRGEMRCWCHSCDQGANKVVACESNVNTNATYTEYPWKKVVSSPSVVAYARFPMYSLRPSAALVAASWFTDLSAVLLSEMVALPRVAVTSLTASVTFSTIADIVDVVGVWFGLVRIDVLIYMTLI